MRITEGLTPSDIGKTYDFYHGVYNEREDSIGYFTLAEFDDAGRAYFLTAEGIKVLGFKKSVQFTSSYIDMFESFLIKKKSVRSIKAMLKTARTPDKVMFYKSKLDKWVVGKTTENSYGVTDKLYLSYFSSDWDSKYLTNEDWDKSYYLDDPDIKSTIKINTLVFDGGELSSDLLINFDYDVCRYEISAQKVIGYHIKHKDIDVYVPKECTLESSSIISNKVTDITLEYAKSIDSSVSDEIKFLLVENFKNNLEIEQLKANYEISKVKNYLYEENFALISESLSGINSRIDEMNKKLESNLAVALKKISSMENDFNKRFDNLEKKVSEGFDDCGHKLGWLSRYTTMAYNHGCTLSTSTVKPYGDPEGNLNPGPNKPSSLDNFLFNKRGNPNYGGSH